MAMDTRQYLAFRCSEMLQLERGILQMNNKMAQEVQTPQLKEQFQRHNGTTEQQIRNLEQVVNRLGGATTPQQQGWLGSVTEALGMGEERANPPITQALQREHEQFIGMKPPQNLIDLNDALEGDKVEHMEMASYNGLILLANQLGETDVAQMLQQNLQSEQQMCSNLESDFAMLMSQQAGPSGRMAA